MKTIWVTSLSSEQNRIKQFISQMKNYGVDVQGHFWKNDLKAMAWQASREEIINLKIALWVILGSDKEFLSADNLYGLSLLAVTIQAQRGNHFPVIILQTAGDLISKDQLSLPLQGAVIISASDAGLGAKVVAAVHKQPKSISPEYHLDILGNDQIGQWFEIGPAKEIWSGVMFGVTGADITFHAVGSSGSLPAKTELNYPVQGLKLKMSEREYTAWAVQNELPPEMSYYVKVDGFPESILFGPYSSEEETDVFVVRLK